MPSATWPRPSSPTPRASWTGPRSDRAVQCGRRCCCGRRRSSAMRFDAGQDDDELTETHEINVTPFIDVILVLLIIFMVAAPLATVNVPVDLPSASAERQPPPAQPLYLTLHKDLSLNLGESAVDRPALGAALETAAKGDHEARVF